MSVTLKLADRDAKLVASILDEVADVYQDGEEPTSEPAAQTDNRLRRIVRAVSSWGGPTGLRQVASAFSVAVRANEKGS